MTLECYSILQYAHQRTILLTCMMVTLTAILATAGGVKHTHGLDDVKVTRGTIKSSYQSPTGEGVKVESEANNFISVNSNWGENVLNITILAPDVLCVSILNSHYIIAKTPYLKGSHHHVVDRVYLVPPAWKKYILKGLAKKISLVWLKKALKLPTRQRIKQDLTRLLYRSETKLLRELAMELSKRGLSGRDSRAAMTLYVLAMRLSSLLPQAESPKNCKYKEQKKSTWYKLPFSKTRQHKEKCPYINTAASYGKQSTTCKTCPKGPSCLGVCGPGCKCWSMMCGDCCYHSGCAGQDHCCRRDGKDGDNMDLSFNCFNVFRFDCDSPPTC